MFIIGDMTCHDAMNGHLIDFSFSITILILKICILGVLSEFLAGLTHIEASKVMAWSLCYRSHKMSYTTQIFCLHHLSHSRYKHHDIFKLRDEPHARPSVMFWNIRNSNAWSVLFM